MTAYTVAREGEGYRFSVSQLQKPSRDWTLPLTALGIIPAALLAPATKFLSFLIYLLVAFAAIKRAKANVLRAPTYGPPVSSFYIDRSGVTLNDGRSVAYGRINTVTLRNAYGGSASLSPLLYAAPGGGGADLATGIGAAMADGKAKRGYYVGIQYGATEERLATNLDKLAATGLQADILRALHGEPID